MRPKVVINMIPGDRNCTKSTAINICNSNQIQYIFSRNSERRKSGMSSRINIFNILTKKHTSPRSAEPSPPHTHTNTDTQKHKTHTRTISLQFDVTCPALNISHTHPPLISLAPSHIINILNPRVHTRKHLTPLPAKQKFHVPIVRRTMKHPPKETHADLEPVYEGFCQTHKETERNAVLCWLAFNSSRRSVYLRA